MKKVTLIAMVALLVVACSGLAMAAQAQVPAQAAGVGNCPFYGMYQNNLTDEQKAQIDTWRQQWLEQRKEMLAKQVEWGWLTQDQANQQISWMEQRIANGAGPGMMGHMRGSGMGGNCRNW
ncbi:hypothetical protein P22_1419 [Propionispora sp. 2/2-37]|uniref:DUF2680 domain-containing protein n=1 Tax=Propionispora sp. 2/2-37 TaxID=1677858 RepID=UPI0006BB67BD|nr:DUF2680 domain-containing protein [Propionispora sp. 2/2-37]CUH95349.1 hypothetical protein P22_1419 [Propionispora sp. 2/2-37]